MKTILPHILLLALFLSGSVAAQGARPPVTHNQSDFDGDGKTDLVLRNRITGLTEIWYMDGTDLKAGKPPKTIQDGNGAPVANPSPNGTSPDDWWRIVGTGLVNNDEKPDIIWQFVPNGHLAVWYQGGSDGDTYVGSFDYHASAVTGWHIVGFGYFNNDSVLDVLWQNDSHPSYPVGQLAFWFMQYNDTTKHWTIATTSTPSYPLVPVSAGWQAVAVGDFGSFPNPNGNRDGFYDIALSNPNGMQALWIYSGANGNQFQGGYTVVDSNGNPVIFSPLSEAHYTRLLSANDFGGPSGSTPATDLLFRRADFADSFAWTLLGKTFQGGPKVGPAPSPNRPLGEYLLPETPNFYPDPKWLDFFDQQWKLSNQPLPDPVARHQSIPNPALGRLSVALSASGYAINWNLLPDFAENNTYKVLAKKTEDSTWHLLAVIEQNYQNYNPGHSGTMINGQPIDPGQRYDFNVTRTVGIPSNPFGRSAQATVAINARPIENRGGVLLLIDELLQAQFSSQMNQIVSDLTRDLVGDGWKVMTATAPRHTDDYTQTGFKLNNFDKLPQIKTTIHNAYLQGANHVLIIGHVVVPYSGYHDPDGHEKRSGPADMFYGDVDGVWQDLGGPAAQPAHGVSWEEHQYSGPDGKMNPSFVPPNTQGVFNGLELAVGRVDFARMPSFGTGNSPSTPTQMQSEVIRIGNYFTKARKYRRSESPYPLPERAVIWEKNGIQEYIAARLRPLVGHTTGQMVDGNSLLQRSTSYLFGYLSGTEVGEGYKTFYWRRSQFVAPYGRFPRSGKADKNRVQFHTLLAPLGLEPLRASHDESLDHSA